MPGMKRDCGGAAAVLGAFYVAVKQVRTFLQISLTITQFHLNFYFQNEKTRQEILYSIRVSVKTCTQFFVWRKTLWDPIH